MGYVETASRHGCGYRSLANVSNRRLSDFTYGWHLLAVFELFIWF